MVPTLFKSQKKFDMFLDLKVIDIIKYVKKLKNFKYTLKKNNKFKETNILKLNSIKAKQKLQWFRNGI